MWRLPTRPGIRAPLGQDRHTGTAQWFLWPSVRSPAPQHLGHRCRNRVSDRPGGPTIRGGLEFE